MRTGRPRTDPEVRFLSHVDSSGECWLWTGHINWSGYAHFWTGDGREYAHRWAYRHYVGPIPNGMQLDHLCRVRHCVNPKHLEPVTPSVNTRRGTSPAAANAVKTHCHMGHEFTSENTIHVPAGRECHACRLEIYKRYRLRKKELA